MNLCVWQIQGAFSVDLALKTEARGVNGLCFSHSFKNHHNIFDVCRAQSEPMFQFLCEISDPAFAGECDDSHH